jgi:hypothetical protein
MGGRDPEMRPVTRELVDSLKARGASAAVIEIATQLIEPRRKRRRSRLDRLIGV